MVSIGIQLYTLRDVERPLEALLARVAAAGYEGVEFANQVRTQDPNIVADTLADYHLDPLGAHVGIDRLEEAFDETIGFYEAIGCTELVVPWLGREHFESEEVIASTASRLDELAAKVADIGMTLHYHNHEHEYIDVGGRPGFHRFLDTSTIDIELDVGFVQLAGDDPVARIGSIGDRCSLLHLKDVDHTSGESVPLGTGDLDVAANVDAFKAVNGEWLVYEYEGANPMDSLDDVATRMVELR